MEKVLVRGGDPPEPSEHGGAARPPVPPGPPRTGGLPALPFGPYAASSAG